MNSEFPFDSSGMTAGQAKLFMDIYLALNENFAVEVDFDFKFEFGADYVFFGNRIYRHGPVFRIDKPQRQLYLCFPCVRYCAGQGYPYGPFTHEEYQPWGYFKLKQDYGHIYIKTETILDEIHNLFIHEDIKFENDPEFSKKFWVAADDAAKAKATLSPQLRGVIEKIKIPEPVIEIHTRDFLFGQERDVTKEAALEIVTFLDKLSGVC